MFDRSRRLRLVSVCLVALAGARGVAAQERIQGATVVQGEEVERFLATAKIVRLQSNTHPGVTGSRVATLELDGVTRSANFKTIDEQKSGITTFANGTSEAQFQDRLAHRGGRLRARQADRPRDGAGHGQADHRPRPGVAADLGRLHDAGGGEVNVDRNLEHLLITNDWRAILIDHSRTFRTQSELKEPKALTRFSTSLLDHIAKLDEKTMTERLGDYLTPWQIKAVLQRRDRILALARALSAANGEANVLYP